jgi:hypothetical protein
MLAARGLAAHFERVLVLDRVLAALEQHVNVMRLRRCAAGRWLARQRVAIEHEHALEVRCEPARGEHARQAAAYDDCLLSQ